MSYLFLFIITILYLIFLLKYPLILQQTSLNSFSFFIKVMIPSIIPMYILSNLILYNKVAQRIMSFFKIFFNRFDNSFSISLFIINILVGNPTGIINIIKAHKEHLISDDDASILVKCCSFINPLFIISFTSLYNMRRFGLFIIVINIISNYIIMLFYKKKKMNFKIENIKIDIISLITNSSHIILNIFAIFYFINIIKTPLEVYKAPNFIVLILDFLELSSGLNHIITCNLNLYIKMMIMLFLVSTTGLSIILQSISEIKKAPNYRCLIKNYISGRIYQMIIVFLFFIIFIN